MAEELEGTEEFQQAAASVASGLPLKKRTRLSKADRMSTGTVVEPVLPAPPVQAEGETIDMEQGSEPMDVDMKVCVLLCGHPDRWPVLKGWCS